MKDEKIKCCICGNEIMAKESHNPFPIGPDSFPGTTENRCCSDCNMMIVAPARIKLASLPELEADKLILKMKEMPYQRLVIFLNQ